MKRGQFEFGWIFAVILGAVILFLAFFFVGRYVVTQRIEKETVSARSFDILITPLSSLGALEATTADLIVLPEPYRIEIECKEPTTNEVLGFNAIYTLSKAKGERGIPRRVYDKYLFAEDLNLSYNKKLQSLTKAIKLPWRVADATMVWPSTKTYCFVKAPDRIRNELESLNISSINFTDKCLQNSIKVCSSSDCDINVDLTKEVGEVRKNNKNLPYAGDTLMLAAIFSEPGLYNCNLKRIASRLQQQIEIYSSTECGKDFNFGDLNNTAAEIVSNPQFQSLQGLWSAVQSVVAQNRYASCKLF